MSLILKFLSYLNIESFSWKQEAILNYFEIGKRKDVSIPGKELKSQYTFHLSRPINFYYFIPTM